MDSGECLTSCIPVVDGVLIASAVETLPFGGRDITDYVQRHLTKGDPGLTWKTYKEIQLAQKMKQQRCYCGAPREREPKKYKLPDGPSRPL